MAITKSTVGTGLIDTVYVDTNANATEQAVTTTGATLYQVVLDNSANDEAVYLKVFDASSAVTVGTTVMDFTFWAPASTSLAYTVASGAVFSNGIRYACTKNNARSDTTNPDSAVTVRFLVDD